MIRNNRIQFSFLVAMIFASATAIVEAQEQASVKSGGPIKVFILSGQSNMVGAGKVIGGGGRWGSEFIDPVVSVYEGTYDAMADYDSMTPLKTLKLNKFGGSEPTPYPGGGTQVTRGFVQVKKTGTYQFRPGYGGSMQNIMEVDGSEVHRQEGKSKAIRSEVKLIAGEKYLSKLLTSQWMRMDWGGSIRWMSLGLFRPS